MSSICIIAIDPATTVAYAYAGYNTINGLWSLQGHGEINKLQVKTNSGRNKSVVDATSFVEVLDSLKSSYQQVVSVIEEVHAMPAFGGGGKKKQGIVSTATFMRALGVIEGVLIAKGIARHYVHPVAWKRKLKVTSDKSSSLYKASLIYPNVKFKTHNIAEAALILYYFIEFCYN